VRHVTRKRDAEDSTLVVSWFQRLPWPRSCGLDISGAAAEDRQYDRRVHRGTRALASPHLASAHLCRAPRPCLLRRDWLTTGRREATESVLDARYPHEVCVTVLIAPRRSRPGALPCDAARPGAGDPAGKGTIVARFEGGRADDPVSAARLQADDRWLGPGRLQPEDLDAVLDASRLVRVPRHQPLLRRGDDTIVCVLGGAMMVRSRSSSGNVAVLRILAPGATWGWAATLGSGGFSADVETITDSSALVTPGPALRRLISERPAVARTCLEAAASELGELQDETARFHNTSTTERVVHRLAQLARTWGRPAEGAIEITLPLTQEDLASWARASRESATKALQELRAGGIISTARREIRVLDVDRLLARSTTREETTGGRTRIPS
jgi:CRP/FNR family transcriptional regulator, cyclic AMP receptor protein